LENKALSYLIASKQI